MIRKTLLILTLVLSPLIAFNTASAQVVDYGDQGGNFVNWTVQVDPLTTALGVSYFDYSVGSVGVSGVLPGAHTAIGLVF